MQTPTPSPGIRATDDGSQTLVHPLHGDTYHSTRGAVGEAMQVFINEGFLHCGKNPVTILEVGFGSGLNAWLTAVKAAEHGIYTTYHTVESYPIGKNIIDQLGYAADPLFTEIHNAEWDETIRISPHFSIKKINAPLLGHEFNTTFDLVYFDAFAPDTQPEMWSREVFANLYNLMNDNAALVTYSAKGTVKQNLRATGFEVTRLTGALGKRHMIRAVK